MTQSLSTPKGDISVRFTQSEDCTALLGLRLESLAMHPEAFAADIDKTAADGVGAFEKLIGDNAKSHAGTISIAYAGAELVGLVGITRGHWPKTRHFGVLWGVYVKPTWRGFHICEAMISEIFDWSKENAVSVIYLGVTISATSAIRCYTRCGFKEYGVEPKAIYCNGIYYDQLLMVKQL
ncbi:MAG: hypothetical protein A2029_06785 [Chloroflexi bacterium RBG_19FT_COMBO_47_9]|nr:MAG: hypothetical protein A2029_06785 [Chloroflexi bacterium RBG_19FT_COMBO_47_9]